LRICDSEAELPVAVDLCAAMTKLDRCSKYHNSAAFPARLGADDSRSTTHTHRQLALSQNRPSPGDCSPAARNAAALVGGQKDKHRRKLGELTRPPQRDVLAERGDLLQRHS
jgi:hypothetical protein